MLEIAFFFGCVWGILVVLLVSNITFCPFIGRYILFVDATFFESKPEIFTSPSFASKDDYDYLLYREILLNSSESTSENVTGKHTLRFLRFDSGLYTMNNSCSRASHLRIKSCVRI